MLGKTAAGTFWMFRYLERCENTTRLLDTAFRISLTNSTASENEWESVMTTIGCPESYNQQYEEVTAARVIDFLLRDKANSGSVLSMVEVSRNNARLVRTALTREVWEAMNEAWMVLSSELARPVGTRNLPATLELIRKQSSLVRAALHGTMLRNDIYDFARLGTFIERADNTARILDVKYYVLLPSVAHVGSSLDNVQWETILHSVSALRAYRWMQGGDITARGIADFLVLDQRMPRSLAFCLSKIANNLGYLEKTYGERHRSHDLVGQMLDRLGSKSIDRVLEFGFHDFLVEFLGEIADLARQIETDYRFYE